MWNYSRDRTVLLCVQNIHAATFIPLDMCVYRFGEQFISLFCYLESTHATILSISKTSIVQTVGALATAFRVRLLLNPMAAFSTDH